MENNKICSFCKDHFSTKGNLTRHLKDNKCKSPLLKDFVLLHEFIQELKINCVSKPKPQSKLEPKINDINSLNLSYLTPDRLRPCLEKYDLQEYISLIIYNKEHPENHIIKYNTRYPPTFEYKGSISVLSEIKEKITDPIVKIIKIHISKCLKFYEEDEEDDFVEEYIKDMKEGIDKDLHSDVSKCIKKILKKILYDPEMKC